MKFYEIAFLSALPFLPALYRFSRREILALLRASTVPNARLLDVGGRKSPYTVGVPGSVTIIDLPQETDMQKGLNLGVSQAGVSEVIRKRSNISAVILEDVMDCDLEAASFDGVICVEVLEHIEDDVIFLAAVSRLMKPNGWLFLTTPNGDYIKNEPPNYNPDHKRHYTRAQLQERLEKFFTDVDVVYGVKTGRRRVQGLRALSSRNPLRIVQAMIANLLNQIESRGLEQQERRTAHLFASARKKT